MVHLHDIKVSRCLNPDGQFKRPDVYCSLYTYTQLEFPACKKRRSIKNLVLICLYDSFSLDKRCTEIHLTNVFWKWDAYECMTLPFDQGRKQTSIFFCSDDII